MKSFTRFTAFVLLTILISACGSVHQPFKSERGTSLRTIGVLTVPAPLPGLGQRQIKKAGFNFGRDMTSAFVKALRSAGYRAVIIKAPRSAGNNFIEDYGSIRNPGVDAFLDTRTISVTYTIGEVNMRSMLDMYSRPYIHIHSRLVSAKSKKIMYAEMVNLTGDNLYVSGGEVALPWKASSPRKYYFKTSAEDRSSPLKDPKRRSKAVTGLRAGLKPIAKHVVSKIKR